MKCLRYGFFLGLCLIGCTQIAIADTRYVTDELQLSLFELINSKGKLLKRLNSGEELELLEQEGLFAKVRTIDGIEGWTKAGFLIESKPARTLLIELQQQHQALTSKLDQTEANLQKSRSEIENLKQQEQKSNAELSNHKNVIATLDQLQQENETLRNNQGQIHPTIPMNWGLIAAGISFVLGITAGIMLFDYRSRRRHGGYRIY